MGRLSASVYVWRMVIMNQDTLPYSEHDRIDKLGDYFVYFKVLKRYGISFEQFIKKVDSGDWETIVRSKRFLGEVFE